MHVGLYVVDGVFDSGLAVICDVLATANSLQRTDEASSGPWAVTLLGAAARTRTGAGLIAHTTRPRDLTAPLDLLVVPAMGTKDPALVTDAAGSASLRGARSYIRATHDAGVPVAAACTSTFLLAETGILDGRTATTSWWLGPVFRKRYPAVHLDESRVLVRTDGVTTAGAAFAHIDLALSIIVARSPALADLVARHLLLDTRASQATFALPALVAQHNPLVAAFERWARSRLEQPLSIAAAAQALAVSERTLQRAVADTLGMSPLDFVHDLRLDHATHLLRTTNLPPEVVATRVGYRNVTTLRRLARRRRNATLGQLRHRPRPGPSAQQTGQ